MKTTCDIRIAGQYTVGDWELFRGHLTSGENPKKWKLAYKIFFQTRLETRYFEPIKLLQKHCKNEGEGFAIVTIQCSLIEFLASTLSGKNYRHCKEVCECGENEYCQSSKLFIEFFTEQKPFKTYFTSKKKADNFYKNVRCALFHEARTKGGWRILAGDAGKTAIDVEKKIVYRDRLQSIFEEFVKWYGAQLPECKKLQAAFIRKFNSLCLE